MSASSLYILDIIIAMFDPEEADMINIVFNIISSLIKKMITR